MTESSGTKPSLSSAECLFEYEAGSYADFLAEEMPELPYTYIYLWTLAYF